MYFRWKKLARQSGDSARLTKVSAIDSVAKGHISVALTGIDIPTRQEFSEGKNIDQEAMSAVRSIETYGRNRCREMVNRPLLFVTSYNPNTDTEWPI